MRGILPRYSIHPCSSSLRKEQKYPMGAVEKPTCLKGGLPSTRPVMPGHFLVTSQSPDCTHRGPAERRNPALKYWRWRISPSSQHHVCTALPPAHTALAHCNTASHERMKMLQAILYFRVVSTTFSGLALPRMRNNPSFNFETTYTGQTKDHPKENIF